MDYIFAFFSAFMYHMTNLVGLYGAFALHELGLW